MKKEFYYCDVCKMKGKVNHSTLQVLFTTEQTEGRGVPTYLSTEKIDLCEKCWDKILKGNYVWGHGAQGHNDYYFKGDK